LEPLSPAAAAGLASSRELLLSSHSSKEPAVVSQQQGTESSSTVTEVTWGEADRTGQAVAGGKENIDDTHGQQWAERPLWEQVPA
jgi:hypothetical protein